MNNLKAYIGFSKTAGPQEGAILIFDHDSREAKKNGWKANTFIHDLCDGEFLDFRVNIIRNEWIMEQHTQEGPQIIENPISCKMCLTWGKEMEGELCVDCVEELGE